MKDSARKARNVERRARSKPLPRLSEVFAGPLANRTFVELLGEAGDILDKLEAEARVAFFSGARNAGVAFEVLTYLDGLRGALHRDDAVRSAALALQAMAPLVPHAVRGLKLLAKAKEGGRARRELYANKKASWPEIAREMGWPDCKKEAVIAAIQARFPDAKRTTIRRFLGTLVSENPAKK